MFGIGFVFKANEVPAMKIFNTKQINLVKKSLDVYQKQHEAIAQNIAHANDPDFNRVKTDFSQVLKTSLSGPMRVTNEKHLSQISEPLRKSTANSEDERVDVSADMGALAENQIKYEFASRALSRIYRGLNLSITGRSS